MSRISDWLAQGPPKFRYKQDDKPTVVLEARIQPVGTIRITVDEYASVHEGITLSEEQARELAKWLTEVCG